MAESKSMKEQGDLTRLKILEAGLKLWPDATPSNIAKELNITHASVLHHFKNVKRSVAEYAVQTGNSNVIVQLIANSNEAVKDMSDEEKRRHFAKFS